MLVDVVTEFAAEVVRPAAAAADEACAAPGEVLAAASRSACRSSACPRRSAASPRSARRWPAPSSPRRSRKGDMGLAVAALAPGSVATALGLWGTDEQQQTYLPAFTGDDVPAAALALTEPDGPLRRSRRRRPPGATATASSSTA